MDPHFGLAAATLTSITIFVVGLLVFGYAPITSDHSYDNETIEKWKTKGPTLDDDPLAGHRAAFATRLIDGAATSLVFSCATFNVLFPLINAASQISSVTLTIAKDKAGVFATSFATAAITFSFLWKLARLKYKPINQENISADAIELQQFILANYATYNVSMIFCWVASASDLYSHAVNLSLFVILLTVDDWNILAKYIAYIPINQLSKSDLIKVMAVSVLLPVIALISMATSFSWSIFHDESSLGVVFMFAFLAYLGMWLKQFNLARRYFKGSSRW